MGLEIVLGTWYSIGAMITFYDCSGSHWVSQCRVTFHEWLLVLSKEQIMIAAFRFATTTFVLSVTIKIIVKPSLSINQVLISFWLLFVTIHVGTSQTTRARFFTISRFFIPQRGGGEGAAQEDG